MENSSTVAGAVGQVEDLAPFNSVAQNNSAPTTEHPTNATTNNNPDELNDVEFLDDYKAEVVRSLQLEAAAKGPPVDYRELYLRRVAQTFASDLRLKKEVAKLRRYEALNVKLEQKLAAAKAELKLLKKEVSILLKRRARERFQKRLRFGSVARKRVGNPFRMVRK
uniref:(northern house mosquito) hypothetical protein n=1 Tax=Culex pipiens TaxID=7175 RepID=A0A8D8NLS9_CULPI